MSFALIAPDAEVTADPPKKAKIEFTNCVTLMCCCPQREYPHDLSVHRLLRYESRYAVSNAPVMKWPWTLRFLGEMEEV